MPHTDTTPVSASIASTGLGIRYIGEHCYALSGTFPASTNPQTTLEFTTGAGYILGEIQLNAAVSSTAPDSGSSTLALITFNAITISIIKAEAGNNDIPTYAIQKVLIPPFTNVKIVVDGNDNQAGQFATVTFSGRVYGAE